MRVVYTADTAVRVVYTADTTNLYISYMTNTSRRTRKILMRFVKPENPVSVFIHLWLHWSLY